MILAQAVATQGPGFVYCPGGTLGCFYEPVPLDHVESRGEDDPRRLTGCLVGVALELAGETRQRGSVHTIHRLYMSFFPSLCTRAAKDYLAVAQATQDLGASWGEAYAMAEASLPLVLAGSATADDPSAGNGGVLPDPSPPHS